ncbi:MAG TPA: RagB/SusD family nutrient uptake outer membrane protein, partial [Chitinophaga sp.]
MKRTFLSNYITLLILALCSFSCNKLLEQEPKNSTYLEKYWQTTRDCESALAGNYALVRNAL